MRLRFILLLSFFTNIACKDVAITLINDNAHTLVQHTIHHTIRQDAKANAVQQLLPSNSTSYKNAIIAGVASLFVAYGSIMLYMANLARTITDDSWWCSWKKEVPLAVLQELTPAQILQELHHDMQKKYGETFLMRYAGDVQRERHLVKTFLQICRCLERCCVSSLFPFYKYKDSLQEKLDRLTYLTSLIESSVHLNIAVPCAAV